MARLILITGGARSGKSTFAETLTRNMAPRVIHVATAQAHDPEMAERIARHRARRGPEWCSIEAPLDLCTALRESDHAPRLVDCITLWLSNLMLAGRDWEGEVAALTAVLTQLSSPVVMVTNEVGAGIVPENALARAFRDAAGLTNQRLAQSCDEVWLCVAGQTLRLKPR